MVFFLANYQLLIFLVYFDGFLSIENKFHKEEKYKVRGFLNTKNIQLFDFHLLANVKETPPYHYSFLFTEGFWKKNEMSFVLTIVFRKSTTPNNLKNQEPILSKKVRVSLSRVLQILFMIIKTKKESGLARLFFVFINAKSYRIVEKSVGFM